MKLKPSRFYGSGKLPWKHFGNNLDPPTRGFSVLCPYRDYGTLSVAIGIYSSV